MNSNTKWNIFQVSTKIKLNKQVRNDLESKLFPAVLFFIFFKLVFIYDHRRLLISINNVNNSDSRLYFVNIEHCFHKKVFIQHNQWQHDVYLLFCAPYIVQWDFFIYKINGIRICKIAYIFLYLKYVCVMVNVHMNFKTMK